MKGTDHILDLSSMHSLILSTTTINGRIVKHLINSAIAHIIWSIWIERNNRCFSSKHCSMSTLFHATLIEVKLSFDLSIVKGSTAMTDLKVARLFGIALKARRLTHTQEVSWTPPPSGCIKLNCDGSSFGSPPSGAIGVVFRNSSSVCLGAFAQNIGHATPLEAEFNACMYALEKAASLHLQHVYVETDLLRVVQAFNTQNGVPWRMQTRWHNCTVYCNQITCSFSHVLREGNLVADALARNGQSLAMFSSQWWEFPPPFVEPFLSRDSVSLPFTRITMN